MARSLLVCALVCLALGAQARQPLGIFDSIGDVVSSAVDTVTGGVSDAAGERLWEWGPHCQHAPAFEGLASARHPREQAHGDLTSTCTERRRQCQPPFANTVHRRRRPCYPLFVPRPPADAHKKHAFFTPLRRRCQGHRCGRL